jgi:hypothetical protein
MELKDKRTIYFTRLLKNLVLFFLHNVRKVRVAMAGVIHQQKFT